MTARRIAISAPDISSLEEEYALAAVRSTWISSTGEYVDRAEREIARMADTPIAITVCNGTAALHLAMLSLGIGPGDEVIVPSLTYIATANAVCYVGATPVFADVSEDTWCIDPGCIERCITPRTRAIIAVHLYGHPADMDAINAIATAHRLRVVEDAAEAHTARYRDRLVGGLADVGVFSFYGNKILSCGEGGAVTLRDRGLEATARLLRGQGMDPARRYYFPIIGHNFRLTNVACAILCAQLSRCDAMLAQRRAVFDDYRRLLADIPGVGLQPVASWASPAPWLFCITIEEPVFGCSRVQLEASLADRGIETRPFFHPLHQLPPYRDGHGHGSLPVTERLARDGLCLPTHTRLSADDIGYIAESIAAARGSR